MQPKQPDKSPGYNESVEEAKNPGAALGLIMGIYPAILVGVLLIGLAALGVRSTFPTSFPKPRPTDSETSIQSTDSNRRIQQ